MSEKAEKVPFGAKIKRLFQPVDLAKGSVWRAILKFAVPIIISYLLQQLYVLSDAAICGQTLSAGKVAGVNDTSPLVFIFMQFAFGCTAGFSVITSQKIGAEDEEGTRRSFSAQIVLSAIICVVLTVGSVLMIRPMLSFVNVTPQNKEVYDAAHDYCLVIFLGLAAQIFYNQILSVLRSIGDSFTPLLFLLVSTALNVVLDLLFIKSFSWGVAGAAGATVLTQFLCTVACFWYTFAKYPKLRLQKKDFVFTKNDLSSHLRQGIPLGLQFSVLSVGIIVMLKQTVRFDLLPGGMMVEGAPAQNGMGAANKLINFAMCPLSALGTAMVSFNAQNLGAGQTGRIRSGMRQAMLIGAALYVLSAGAGLLLSVGGAYQHIFLSADKITAESIRFGNAYLYVDLPLFFLLGMLFILRNGVQGVGKSVWTLAAGAGELVARILICTFLPRLVNGGLTNALASHASFVALCFGDPGAWLFAVLILLYPYFRYIVKEDYAFAGIGKSGEAGRRETQADGFAGENAAQTESSARVNSAQTTGSAGAEEK